MSNTASKSMAVEVYPNQPLIEAVFEIQFDGELSVDSGKDKFFNSIRANYPQLSIGQPVADPSGFPRYLCKKMDGTEAVQFTITRCSFHSYKYHGFESFQEKALGIINSFCKMFNIQIIRRTGLRYVNHIPIVRENGYIPLEKYLHFSYKLPKSLSEGFGFQNLLTILEIKKGDGDLRLQISNLLREDGIDRIVLDFDYSKLGELVATNLQSYLEASHAHTKQVFEDMVTDYLRQIMRGSKS